MRNNYGFSLYELLTVIAIIGVVSAIVIPNMIVWRNNAKFGEGTRDIYSAFQRAKSRAARENVDVSISFVPNGSLDGEYLLFVDNGEGTGDADADGVLDGLNNGVRDGTEPILFRDRLPTGVKIDTTTFAGHVLVFQGNGLPDWNGHIEISNSSGGKREIWVSLAGGIEIRYP